MEDKRGWSTSDAAAVSLPLGHPNTLVADWLSERDTRRLGCASAQWPHLGGLLRAVGEDGGAGPGGARPRGHGAQEQRLGGAGGTAKGRDGGATTGTRHESVSMHERGIRATYFCAGKDHRTGLHRTVANTPHLASVSPAQSLKASSTPCAPPHARPPHPSACAFGGAVNCHPGASR